MLRCNSLHEVDQSLEIVVAPLVIGYVPELLARSGKLRAGSFRRTRVLTTSHATDALRCALTSVLLSEMDNLGRAFWLIEVSAHLVLPNHVASEAVSASRCGADLSSTLSTPPHWPTHRESKSAFCPTTAGINDAACTWLSSDPLELASYWPEV